MYQCESSYIPDGCPSPLPPPPDSAPQLRAEPAYLTAVAARIPYPAGSAASPDELRQQRMVWKSSGLTGHRYC
jgi:hypothetical protein